MLRFINYLFTGCSLKLEAMSRSLFKLSIKFIAHVQLTIHWWYSYAIIVAIGIVRIVMLILLANLMFPLMAFRRQCAAERNLS